MRTLPPAYSPVGLGDLVGSAIGALSGDARARLQAELEERFGADTVVLTSGGTHALQLSFELLSAKLGRPARIGLPGYSCYDIITAAVGAGASVRLYDVDPTSLGPEWDSFTAVLPAVDAIVVGNLFAFPLDWTRIVSLAEAHGVDLIEDAAQGIGAEGPTGPAGCHGAASVLSFGRGKGWTGGGGGALLVRGPMSDTVASLQVGPGGGGSGVWMKAAVAWLLGRPSLFKIPILIPGLGVGETTYKEASPARGLTRTSGHMVRRTGAASHEIVALRRRVAGRWRDSLAGVAADGALAFSEPVPAHTPGYLRMPVRVLGRPADEVVRRGRGHGIARGYPKALHHLSEASQVLDQRDALPGSEELAATLVTLPTHHWVREQDMTSAAALF